MRLLFNRMRGSTGSREGAVLVCKRACLSVVQACHNRYNIASVCKVSMIQKPSLKNGQNIIHDATSKTSSVVPQQQQEQQQRKGERSSNVPDVVKNGNGGYQLSANHGVAKGHMENGRSSLSNGSAGLAYGSQNGTHGRHNGSGSGPASAKPVPNGNASSSRPQSYSGCNAVSVGKSGGKSLNLGANGAAAASKQPVARAAVQPIAGGGRGRDTSAPGGSYPIGGAAATDNGGGTTSGHADGALGARPRDGRRRGGHGRGGAVGPESAPASADASVSGINAAGGGSGGGAPERQQERSGRPRGDRRPRSAAQKFPDANGSASAIVGGQAIANGAHEDAERGEQRGSRPRGRRGRGGQHAGTAEVGEQGSEAQRTVVVSVVPVDGLEEQQDRKLRQPRQRPPRAPRPPSQSGAPEGLSRESSQTAPADGQQNGSGSQQRRGREPRQPQGQQQQGQVRKQRPQNVEEGERDEPEGGRGGGRGRSGRRRNGSFLDISGPGAGSVEAGAVAGQTGTQADGDGTANGRSLRPPRPPRQPQPQPAQEELRQLQEAPQVADQPQAVPSEQTVEQPPAPPASHLHYQTVPAAPLQPPPAPPQPFDQSVEASAQAPLSAHHSQVSIPLPPQQHLYPSPPFQNGQPLLDFQQQQQLLHHLLPQHQYPPPPEYQQQHFLQHQHHQFDSVYQQFQQQLLQQHLGPPPPGGHGFIPGPYNAPGGPMAGPPLMPPSFYPGVNGYGQMLAPPPAFGSAPAHPAMPQDVPAAPASQQMPPEDLLNGAHQLRAAQQPPEVQFHAADPSAPVQEQLQQDQQQQVCAAIEESMPEVAAPPPPEVATLAVPVEPEAPSVVAAAPAAPAPEVPGTEPVKNEWADRLAQQALARMNAVKSSLISGTGCRSEGLRSAGGGNADERSRSSSLARPPAITNGAANGSGPYSTSPRGTSANGGSAYSNDSEPWRSNGEQDAVARRSGGVSSPPAETWRNGAASNGPPASEAGNGWRASLAPTGAADAAEAWRMRDRSEDASESQAPAPYQPPRRDESPPLPPGPVSSASGRPRLNLQPRTKPLPPPPGNPAAAACDCAAIPANGSSAGASTAARSSIFGAARPREEVLRDRGVTEPDRLTAGNVAYANGSGSGSLCTGGGRVGGRAGSATSGASDEDQWQTVGKGGRSKMPQASSDVGNALMDAASDPFFTGRTTAATGVAIIGRSIPSGRVYGAVNGQYGSYGKGSYGSHGAGGDTYMNAFGASRGYGAAHGNDEDEPIFRRGLPTRNDGPF